MPPLPLATEIENDVAALLASALARNSTQGVLVYQAVLKQLHSDHTPAGLAAVSEGLEKFFAGVEAHGHFNKEEWEAVVALRLRLAGAG